MKPLGRKSIQMPGAKHKPKGNGKNIPGWWEFHEEGNKRADRQKVRLQLITVMKNESHH